MNRKRTAYLILFTAAASCLSAQTCVPPPGFVDRPHPAMVDTNELGSAHRGDHGEPPTRGCFKPGGTKTDIKDAIHKAGDLPGVTGHYALNQIPFGSVGARRLVCLSDGATLEEEVLETRQAAIQACSGILSGTIRANKRGPSSMAWVNFMTSRSTTRTLTLCGPIPSNSRMTSSRDIWEAWAASFFGGGFSTGNMRHDARHSGCGQGSC